ncbi:glycosyltransferase family 39 protein [bacterium]|nr:glycosyltransferase family 39 protein [bacterium]
MKNENYPSWLLPVLLTFLALLLRLPGLGYSFYGDEGFSLLRDSDHFITQTEDRFRPVFFSLLFLWRTIGFDGEIGLRLLPLIFGVLSVPLAWICGNKLGGRNVALGLSLLLVTSPFHIEFSQELRMYSLVVFISFAQLACYLYYRESRRFLPLVLGTIVALVGMYTHLFYVLYLLGFGLLAILDKRTLPYKTYLASLVVVALLYLPNIGNVLYFQTVRQSGYAVHLASALPKLAAALSIGFNLFNLPDLGLGRGVGLQVVYQNWHYVLLCLIVFGLLVLGAVRFMFSAEGRFALILKTSLLAFPTVLALAASFATHKNFASAKYIVFLLPPLLLFFVWGFSGLRKKPLQIGVGVLYGVLVAIALLHYYTAPETYGRRLNWSGAAEYLDNRLKTEAPLVLIDGFSYRVLQYYATPTRPYWKFVKPPEGSVDDYTLYLRDKLSRASEIYYLREDDVQNQMDPNDIVLKTLRTLGTDETCIPYNRRLMLYHWKITLKNL